jgi:hypothetical protein
MALAPSLELCNQENFNKARARLHGNQRLCWLHSTDAAAVHTQRVGGGYIEYVCT